ncbi:MAG: prepilin-type N-terminal cleavage/methylation domain-containing protein [Magnetococcales bacterium]|nr:prepilin-type N-terminal cleavage/methylation domain-containing protein [Magnetococcales bacterium]MBF0172431.1 prepilin-type N-terminal cleavage/methylation domain-containing protein [Magnetococcales bacterium]MBF0631393.1 prepilin-type N-terminal cleavage/methylation domain-containing protein [Magnetococcales bacterium]
MSGVAFRGETGYVSCVLRLRQSGSTLVELMVASLISLIIGLVVVQTVFQIERMVTLLLATTRMNQEARELFFLLLSGGRDGSLYFPGIHGHESDPTGRDLDYSGGRIWLGKWDNGTGIYEGGVTSYDIVCQKVDDPLPQCSAGGEHVIGEGMVLEFTTSQLLAVHGRTLDVTYRVFEPQLVPRGTYDQYHQPDYMVRFWTSVGLMLAQTPVSP